jgi:hypothetical protein
VTQLWGCEETASRLWVFLGVHTSHSHLHTKG